MFTRFVFVSSFLKPGKVLKNGELKLGLEADS